MCARACAYCRYEAVVAAAKRAKRNDGENARAGRKTTKKKTSDAYAPPPVWRTLLLPADTVVATESMRALHALLATAVDSNDQV